jgi:quercetin dioxygenase-like cupin family protein
MRFLKAISLVVFSILLSACDTQSPNAYTPEQIASVVVMTPDQVSYQPLNPARAETSPKAGVLWGDIRKDVPSGVILKFAEGFSSPPHIHNITYRAIVIDGEIHNDDPDAANMWMDPGTFWTQPAGEVHITSARPGVGGTGFLEILEGPYLVQPGDKAFDNGERPLNLVSSNMIWMSADEMNWIQGGNDEMNWIQVGNSTRGPKATLLWGNLSDGELSGSMIKLPQGYKADLSTNNGDLKAVVIQGDILHSVESVTEQNELSSGGYFASAEGVSHSLKCEAKSECIIYIRTQGSFLIQ